MTDYTTLIANLRGERDEYPGEYTKDAALAIETLSTRLESARELLDENTRQLELESELDPHGPDAHRTILINKNLALLAEIDDVALVAEREE